MGRVERAAAAGLLLAGAVLINGALGFAQAPDAPAGQTLNPLSSFDPSTLNGFLKRPLFSPSRTAADAPEVIWETPVSAVPAPSGNFRLLGVVSTPRGLIARVLDVDDGRTHGLRKGDTLREWSVVSVSASGIELGQGSTTLELRLFSNGGTAESPLAASRPDEDAALPDAPTDVRIIPGPTAVPGEGGGAPAGPAPPWSEREMLDFFGDGAVQERP